MDFKKARNMTHASAIQVRNARWWGVCFHTKGMEEDDTDKLLEEPIQAYTKSEARAVLKRKLGVDKLPSRVSLEEIIVEVKVVEPEEDNLADELYQSILNIKGKE